MKLTKEQLKKLITEEFNRLDEVYVGDDQPQEPEAQEPTQQYIDFVVAVQEAARETLEEIEKGSEPYQAATDSRFNQLVRGFVDEEFHHYFFG